MLEHMYFKGTPSRGVGEIAKETKAAGGYLNAAHDLRPHELLHRPSVVELRCGLDVQADAYAHSLIDSDELARELEVIIQEAKRKADNPAAVATETLYELLHDRHRIRRWRIGREPGLRALRTGRRRRLLSKLLSSGQHDSRRSSATSIPMKCSRTSVAGTARWPPAIRRARPARLKTAPAADFAIAT